MTESTATSSQRLVLETQLGAERFALGGAALDSTHGGISILAKQATSSTDALPGYIWLQTQGNVTATSGNQLQSTMTFQSSGIVNFQSWESSTYLFSAGSTAVFGGEKTFLTTPGSIALFAGPPHKNPDGSDRVSLMTATASDPSERPTNSTAVITYPSGTVGSAVKTAKNIWWSINTGVVTSCLSFFAYSVIKKSKALGSVANALKQMYPAVLGSFASFDMAVAGSVTNFDDDPHLAPALRKGAFSLFSYSGLLMGTPGFAAVYGGLAYAYRSLNVTQLGYALASVKCLGGPITLFSMVSVSSACARGTTEVEAETTVNLEAESKELTVEGLHVELGGEFSVSKIAKEKTKTIALASTKQIEVDAGASIDIHATDTAEFEATNKAAVEANQSLTIKVGDDYEVTLTAAGGIKCRKVQGGGPSLEITSEGIKLMGPGGGCQLKLSPTGVALGSESDSLLIGPAAVTAPLITEIC